VDKAARLTITITGTSRNVDIQLPEIDNIRLHNQGSSSQIRVVNSAISSSISHNYLVEADQPGRYTIPSITVSTGGKSYASQPLHFQVTPVGRQPSGHAGSTGQKAGELAFIRISEKSAGHYSGEIVPLTIKAYFTQAYRADINSLPTLDGDGVVMAQLQDKPRQTEESVNGRMYHVLTWDTSLSGVKVGEHPIHFTLDATLLIPKNRRPLSPFGGSSLFDDSFFNDSAFDSFFGSHQRKPIVSVSPRIVFTVLPLPSENQPDNFTGAIGDFDLKVAATPLEVEIGEPITLTMEISGTGNFDRVEPPVFPESPDWKTYSPTSNFVQQRRNYSGTKLFEQAVVARSGAVTGIPALSFSYFDPREKKYITKTSGPVTIALQKPAGPAVGQPVQPVAPPAQPPPPPTATATTIAGLAPIHLETGTYRPRIVPLVENGWWRTGSILSLVALLAVVVFRLRQRNIEKHPERARQRQIKFLLENDLKMVEQAQAAGDGIAFLTLGRRAIQNQLGLLWHIEPAALSLADIKSRLKADSPLIAIFSAAEEAAYGGATLSEAKMQDYLVTLKMELEALL
jgi:hypothetical protein